jgi:hypothetical protein
MKINRQTIRASLPRARLRMLVGAALWACLVALCIPVSDGEARVPHPTPEEMKNTLLNGHAAERASLAKTLRLLIPKEAIREAPADIPCTDIDSIDSENVQLRSPGTQTVLVVRSHECEYVFLVVLERNADGAWSLVQTVPLVSHVAEPQIEFDILIEAGQNEIVVRHNEEDYGTGIIKIDMTIFKLTRTGLEVVFDEPEHLVFAIPSDQPEDQPERNTEESIESEFRFVSPDRSDATSLRWIEQKETIRQHQTEIVLNWRYVWNPRTLRFQGVAYSP